MRRTLFLVSLLALVTGCVRTEKSATGFRLPDGDAERGRILFTELRCHECHRLDGIELQQAATGLARPVLLGGETLYAKTDGDLVTSIIHPSHRISRVYPTELVSVDGKSKMRDYNDALTVRQLIDLVAFLHSRYRTVPPPMPSS